MNKLKKGWWAVALLAMVCLAAACGGDDGVMDRPDRMRTRLTAATPGLPIV